MLQIYAALVLLYPLRTTAGLPVLVRCFVQVVASCHNVWHYARYFFAYMKLFFAAIILVMDKKKLIEYLGGTCAKAAERLGYSSTNARNNIQRLSDPLTPRQVKTITMRMKAFRIKIPAELQS